MAALKHFQILSCWGRGWALDSSHSAASRKSFEAELKKLQAAIDKSGGPYVLGSCVSTVSIGGSLCAFMPQMNEPAVHDPAGLCTLEYVAVLCGKPPAPAQLVYLSGCCTMPHQITKMEISP